MGTATRPPSPFSDLDPVERQTFTRHASAAMLDSAFMAVCWSAPDIAVKGLRAETFVVVLITLAPGAAQLLSLGLGKTMARLGRRRLLRVAAIAGRLPLIGVYFAAGPYSFLGLLVVQAISQVAITTSWNSLLRANYRPDRRGALFAAATMAGSMASGSTMVLTGLWLDRDATAYHVIYPIAAIVGVVACFVFASIDVRRGYEADEREGLAAGELVRTFLRDRRFLLYEIGFFLYGLAFMSLMTSKPLRMARPNQLDFAYSVLLGAKGVFAVSMAAGVLFMGRLMDRLGPAGLAMRCYALLVVYAGLLMVVSAPWQYFVAEALMGVAMGGVHIAWNLG
ncbi:MAG: MFS transporter, partial [Planctomycetes bacterium]|nr:MFS transporter [Planctomycetota bacterium]